MRPESFYDTIDEARIRLHNTIVLYDGEPFWVFRVTNHKEDGVFRVYLRPCGLSDPNKLEKYPDLDNFPSSDSAGAGPYLDKWIEDNPKAGYVCQQINSPGFNKFRPFPLGMCNIYAQTSYLERQPNRSTYQGLIRQMINEYTVSAGKSGLSRGVEMNSPAFRGCILGEYPSPEDCIAGLRDPSVENEAVAFCREFAFVRGPLDMLLLAYKSNIIGILPNQDLTSVRLGDTYGYTKEIVSELNLFRDINN